MKSDAECYQVMMNDIPLKFDTDSIGDIFKERIMKQVGIPEYLITGIKSTNDIFLSKKRFMKL